MRFLLAFSLLFFTAPVFVLFAHGEELLVWVKYNMEKKRMELSSGGTAQAGLQAGQYYEIKRGRMKPEKQWRSPLDLIVPFPVKNPGRAEFSHERHFAALGQKTCNVCHDESKGIGSDRGFPSLAAGSSGEPHGEKSYGRFCSGCHDGKTRVSDLPDAKVEGRGPVLFTAFGKKGDSDCGRCHAPASHGRDYVSRHGETAEEQGSKECARCHRGTERIAPDESRQAAAYKNAQLALIRNPEDAANFKAILPDNFCVYCHNSDLKPWKESKEYHGRYRKEREGRYGEKED